MLYIDIKKSLYYALITLLLYTVVYRKEIVVGHKLHYSYNKKEAKLMGLLFSFLKL